MTKTPSRKSVGPRPDGFVVRFSVTHYFDTNLNRTGYDLVGVDVRCAVCGEELRGIEGMADHARTHEPLPPQ